MSVYFIRHAESTANVAAHAFPRGSPERETAYQDSRYFNAELSDQGKADADAVTLPCRPQAVDFVIVSTLHRTLETARRALTEISPARQSPDDGVVDLKCRWIATDCIREWAQGEVHPCDYRDGNLGAERGRYPWVEFPADTPQDPIPHNESLDALRERIREFGRLIAGLERSSNESAIVVVTHSAFLSELFLHFLKREDCQFKNCECKEVSLKLVLEKIPCD